MRAQSQTGDDDVNDGERHMIGVLHSTFLDRSCLACTFRKYVCNIFFYYFFFLYSLGLNRKCFTFENFPSSRRAAEAAFDSISKRLRDIVGNIICR